MSERDKVIMAEVTEEYWIGHDEAVHALCRQIGKILDGEDDGSGVAQEPWESIRRRLLALRAKAG